MVLISIKNFADINLSVKSRKVISSTVIIASSWLL